MGDTSAEKAIRLETIRGKFYEGIDIRQGSSVSERRLISTVPEIDVAARIKWVAAINDGVPNDTDNGFSIIAVMRVAQRDRPIGIQGLLGKDLFREVVEPERFSVATCPLRPPSIWVQRIGPSVRFVLAVLPEITIYFGMAHDVPSHLFVSVKWFQVYKGVNESIQKVVLSRESSGRSRSL